MAISVILFGKRMNINAFLTCLGYFNVSTGASASLEGVYALNSGTTGIIYNQLYSTGYHFLSGLIYTPALPLIDVETNPITSSYLSGNSCFRLGYEYSGNFAALMDISYSGCSRVRSGQGYILLSTVDNLSGLGSGFLIGINDANRIYFQTQGTCYTLPTELCIRDIVYTSLSQSQYVNFGIYKFEDGTVYEMNVDVGSPSLNTNSLYFGNFLDNQNRNYTGFIGQLNQILLFSNDLNTGDIASCSQCCEATGFQLVSTINNYSGIQITGANYSGVYSSTNSGIANLTGHIMRGDGSFITVIYGQTITGQVQTGVVVTPGFTYIPLQTSGSTYQFLYDSGAMNSFSTRTIEFDLPLSSGDIVEVETYTQYNNNIGNIINNLIWPPNTGFIQLIGNGLYETLNQDYEVVHNFVSGFTTGDNLSYDILIGSTIVTDYSGYWNNTKILMSGGSYFPPSAQYYENLSFSGQVWITGLNQVSINNPYYPSFGYDLYMNGQKLVSGLQYSILSSGTGFIVTLSGINLPELLVDTLSSPTGGLPTGIEEVYDSELMFAPQFPGFSHTQYNVTGSLKVIGPITGFSTQIWVNGLRQVKGKDYIEHCACDYITGFYYPPILPFTAYNSMQDSIGLWTHS